MTQHFYKSFGRNKTVFSYRKMFYHLIVEICWPANLKLNDKFGLQKRFKV